MFPILLLKQLDFVFQLFSINGAFSFRNAHMNVIYRLNRRTIILISERRRILHILQLEFPIGIHIKLFLKCLFFAKIHSPSRANCQHNAFLDNSIYISPKCSNCNWCTILVQFRNVHISPWNFSPIICVCILLIQWIFFCIYDVRIVHILLETIR